MLGGAIRVSTPFLFVSLGECLTEKSGRINLGLEGILVMGAMSGYGVSYLTGSPWLGVLAAGLRRACCSALLHGLICNLPRVNDIAVGIGADAVRHRPRVLPRQALRPAEGADAARDRRSAPGASSPQIQAALQVNPLFLIGIALALALGLGVPQHALGPDRAHGRRQRGRGARHGLRRERACARCATAAGGFLAGVGGSFLSLYYPGSWNEGLSSGQGLMAVALVIFARWDPLHCF